MFGPVTQHPKGPLMGGDASISRRDTLKAAQQGERRGYKFYCLIASHSTRPVVSGLAKEFVKEEPEQIKILEAWIAREGRHFENSTLDIINRYFGIFGRKAMFFLAIVTAPPHEFGLSSFNKFGLVYRASFHWMGDFGTGDNPLPDALYVRYSSRHKRVSSRASHRFPEA